MNSLPPILGGKRDAPVMREKQAGRRSGAVGGPLGRSAPAILAGFAASQLPDAGGDCGGPVAVGRLARMEAVRGEVGRIPGIVQGDDGAAPVAAGKAQELVVEAPGAGQRTSATAAARR